MKNRINLLPKDKILGPPYITNDEVKAVIKVIKSGQLSLGGEIEKFESEIADYSGARFAAVTSSGTAALHLSVVANGIKEGDEVITTPFSFVASTNCFLYERAIPIFVDIDKDSFNLDANKIKPKITKKTKAIIGVDIFGYPADWQEILTIAKQYNLRVIEDAAEAFGAKYKGKTLGSLGHPTVFAFYPNKQMTTGEGGAVVTNSKQEYELIKGLLNQGRGPDMQWLKHPYLGYNYRMTEMSAAMGRVQLKKLDEFLKNRSQVADWYKERLMDVDEITLMKPDNKNQQRSWFVYVVRLDKRFDRDQVIRKLINLGIPSKAYLPSIHLQPYMKKYGFKKGDFPVSEAVSESTLSLPFYTGMKEETVEQICEIFKKVLR
jgi:dTDP-4-amino-4,6-dideoxygalactose transaminase